MFILLLIAEGLGLGLLICFYCYLGIRNGAVGLVHLYSDEVQKRAVELKLTTFDEINKRCKILKLACAVSYTVYVIACVYIFNGVKDFTGGFLQIFVILSIANIIDRLVIDEYWVGHSKKWIIPGTEDLMPYISVSDKKKKWIGGTVGYAVIAAVVAEIINIIIF